MENVGNLVFIIVPIVAICIFIITFLLMVSPKLRGKMMSRQIKSVKYMLDESQDDLREMANKAKEGMKGFSSNANDGFSSWDNYCKHCGAMIDADSVYCKRCGHKQ